MYKIGIASTSSSAWLHDRHTFSPQHGTSTCFKIALHSVLANISASNYSPPRLCLPLSSHQLFPSRSDQLHSIIIQGTHQLPITVIHRVQDTKLNKGIICTILPGPSSLLVAGVFYPPLPNLNMEDLVNLADKEN